MSTQTGLRPYPRLNPTTDVVFKILFSGNEDILISLLTAVIKPTTPITEAKVLNPELPKVKIDDKGTIMDIRVRFADGTLVGVEMQTSSHTAVDARWLYYWAKNYAEQIRAGGKYEKLRKVIGVYFLDYSMEKGRFHGIYEARERTTGRLFSEMLELHTIELPRLNPLALEGLQAAPDKLEAWSRFLTSHDPHEITALTESDPMIEKAEKRLEELSADPAVMTLAEEREFGLNLLKADQMGQRTANLKEGRVEGRKEGRVEGLRDSIRLVCESLDVEFTPARLAALEDDATDLRALMKTLVAERCWPD